MPVPNLLTVLQNGARARVRSIPLPYTNAALGITSILLQHGFIHNVTRGTIRGPSPAEFLQTGVAGRRLWVDMKYGNDDYPVLSHALPVSKPSKKINLDAREMLRLVTGRRAQFVAPLQLGEIAIVRCMMPSTAQAAASRAGQVTAAALAKVARSVASPQAQATAAEQQQNLGSDAPSSATADGHRAPKTRMVEQWLEARDAVGRGLGGEVVARIG